MARLSRIQLATSALLAAGLILAIWQLVRLRAELRRWQELAQEASVTAPDGIGRRRVILPPADRPFSEPPRQSHEVPPLRMGERTVTMLLVNGRLQLTDDQRRTVGTLPERLVVTAATVSPNGQWALLRVARREAIGPPLVYQHLLRLHSTGETWETATLWQTNQRLVPAREWWVEKVGAVGDDGEVALVELGTTAQPGGVKKLEWQTWQLSPSRRLGTGLSVGNGIRER